MPDYCSCGAQLPDDALFCHKCGKPQRHLMAVEPEIPAGVALPPPLSVAKAEPLPLNFHNPVAVRIALIVGLVTSLLSWLPLLNIVLWAAGGFFAVLLYRRRTGHLLDVRDGVQMGWITGVLTFTIFTATLLPAALSGGVGAQIQALFKAQFKNVTDPSVQEIVKMFESGPGLALFLVILLFMMFVFIIVLSIAGGALGAKMTRRG
jgi:hypothetical protein